MPWQRTNGRWPKGKANGVTWPNTAKRWQKSIGREHSSDKANLDDD